MTEVRKEITSRIQDVASKALLRVWCGAHQLELALKAAIDQVPDDFMTTLTTLTGYLRHQQDLISEMKSKPPHYIKASSLWQVSSWYMNNRERVKRYFSDHRLAGAPSEQWWLTLVMLHKMLDMFHSSSASLRGTNITLRQQTAIMGSLIGELVSAIGAVRENGVPLDANSDTLVLEEEDASRGEQMRFGPFTIRHNEAERHIRGNSILTIRMASRLEFDERAEVTKVLSRIYLQAIYSVASLASCGRETRIREKTDAAPPVLPLSLAALPLIEFTELLSEHEERLRHSFPSTLVDQGFNNEFKTMQQLTSEDCNLKTALRKASESSQGDFQLSWRPLGCRFPHLLRFAAGLATAVPGPATVEADFAVINYQRDQERPAFTNLSLEGVLHSRQLENLRQTYNEMMACEDGSGGPS